MGCSSVAKIDRIRRKSRSKDAKWMWATKQASTDKWPLFGIYMVYPGIYLVYPACHSEQNISFGYNWVIDNKKTLSWKQWYISGITIVLNKTWRKHLKMVIRLVIRSVPDSVCLILGWTKWLGLQLYTVQNNFISNSSYFHSFHVNLNVPNLTIAQNHGICSSLAYTMHKSSH